MLTYCIEVLPNKLNICFAKVDKFLKLSLDTCKNLVNCFLHFEGKTVEGHNRRLCGHFKSRFSWIVIKGFAGRMLCSAGIMASNVFAFRQAFE